MHRLTLEETRRFLAAALPGSEQRIAYLGVCAGLRRNEMCLLRGRHFAREGWIWIPPELAKGGRERWIPVIRDVAPIVRDIRDHTSPDEYVLPATVWVPDERGRLGPFAVPERRRHAKTIWRAVRRIGRRAGLATLVHPHLLRHAFAEHVTRRAGLTHGAGSAGACDHPDHRGVARQALARRARAGHWDTDIRVRARRRSRPGGRLSPDAA